MQPKATAKRKPRAPKLPQPIQLADIDEKTRQDLFWAACTLNDDGELQAITQFRDKATHRSDIPATAQNAFTSATRYIRDCRDEAAQMCKEAGGLLFAFHGSKAFEVAAC